MSFFNKFFSAGTGGVINALSSGFEVFVGNKGKREQGTHNIEFGGHNT